MHTSSASTGALADPTNKTDVYHNDLFNFFALRNRDVRLDGFPLTS